MIQSQPHTNLYIGKRNNVFLMDFQLHKGLRTPEREYLRIFLIDIHIGFMIYSIYINMLINKIKSCLTMEDGVGNSVSNWVSNSKRVSNSMSNWVSNSMDYWVSNSVSNRVSNNSCLDNSWSILRNSLICDILDDSITIVSVLDSLDSSIRKVDSVAARGCVSISGLSLLEVSSTVVIIDSILVSIGWRLNKIRGNIGRDSNKGPAGAAVANQGCQQPSSVTLRYYQASSAS